MHVFSINIMFYLHSYFDIMQYAIRPVLPKDGVFYCSRLRVSAKTRRNQAEWKASPTEDSQGRRSIFV